LIFEEFFWLELFLAQRKAGFKKEYGPKMERKLQKAEAVEKSLPFELTKDQKKTFEEILKDITDEAPMHRLVQGDVGSGKTRVALLSACVAVENGYQVTVMAPTEILTEQHYVNAKKWLEP